MLAVWTYSGLKTTKPQRSSKPKRTEAIRLRLLQDASGDPRIRSLQKIVRCENIQGSMWQCGWTCRFWRSSQTFFLCLCVTENMFRAQFEIFITVGLKIIIRSKSAGLIVVLSGDGVPSVGWMENADSVVDNARPSINACKFVPTEGNLGQKSSRSIV